MNRLGVILFIALKHLMVRRRQSLVTILSVAMGAMILVVTLAMMEGLLREVRAKLLESNPAVIVEPNEEGGLEWVGPDADKNTLQSLRRGSPPRRRDDIARYPGAEALIKTVPGVTAVAPRACIPVIVYHGSRSEPSQTCGIEARSEKEVTRLWGWMREGRVDDLDGSGAGIILGAFLAEHLSARVGSRVKLISAAGVAADFDVVGIFASGVTRIDSRQSYVRLSQGQRLLGESGAVSMAGVNVADLDQAAPIARQISRLTGLSAQTWEEANQSAIGAFRMMGVSTYFLVIFTAVVGGFGILNIMITIVMEKQRDIALLGSVGYTPGQVLGIFFGEALLLGAAGSALGCALGYAAAEFIASLPMPTTEASAIQRPGLGMAQDPWFYVIAFSLSLAISLIAGVGPARRAARLDPVAILRGER